jgi:hypothetical protein
MELSRYKDYNFEKKLGYIEQNSQSYIELIQEFSDNGHKGFYDVILDLEFSRQESIQSIKDIIQDMQLSDIDINIIDNHNKKFLIAMPCTAYKNFNDALNMFVIAEEPENQLNQIKEFICLPSLNKITTLEELKFIAN